ncbi:MAG: FHA domain-containing protein [Candidatus Abyssubacteria bacterium]|nr:FHA domain-containing protein [Candidatus Abyssubacteria bacterium]
MKQPQLGEAPAEKAGPIKIEIMNGPEDGRVVVCDILPISIGRADESSVSLLYDHLISRRHALVTRSGDDIFLKDLNSRNGTFVGKERVRESTPIEPDELFRVGATLLRVRPR